MTHPLAEVFGFPPDDMGKEAMRHRRHRLCPFNNRVPNCTKDKVSDPLGVCSIFTQSSPAIVCPVRFREGWIIVEESAAFLFPPGTRWTSLSEVRLNDKHGKSAGNIDLVLVAYDEHGKVLDFGGLEIQAVYISGNIRRPFQHYMDDPGRRYKMDWSSSPNYPRPDYLSSSRKRLAPQLVFKGGILRAWGKRITTALQREFYETLPTMAEVPSDRAEMAWLVYDLVREDVTKKHVLTHIKTVYTLFAETLERINRPEPGDVDDFIAVLQEKVDEKLDEHDAQMNEERIDVRF